MSPSDQDLIVLVDENDKQLSTMQKIAAHQNGGKLHRAFSIFVFNSKGEVMLQQRAMTKYHSVGKWSNTCCSHPWPGESVIDAGHRKLVQEMGFDCELKEAFSFIYHADVGNGLKENEFDHVLFGTYDKDPNPNPEEAMGWKWSNLTQLRHELHMNPDKYTPWLVQSFDEIMRKRGLLA